MSGTPPRRLGSAQRQGTAVPTASPEASSSPASTESTALHRSPPPPQGDLEGGVLYGVPVRSSYFGSGVVCGEESESDEDAAAAPGVQRDLYVASCRSSLSRELVEQLRALHGISEQASGEEERRFVSSLEVCREEVWENQRWMVVKGWSKPLGPERSHWSDKTGTRIRLREGVMLPHQWEWVDDWHVDEYEGSDGGWYYAGDFTTSIRDCRPSPGMSALVRRRRWVRTRTRTSDEQVVRTMTSGTVTHWYWCQRESYGFPPSDPPPPAFTWAEDQRRHNALAAWKSYFESHGGIAVPLRHDGKPAEVKGRVKELIRRYGCPSMLRQKLWMDCSGAARKKRENAGYYACVVERHGGDQTWAGRADVERDLERTFTEHSYFNISGAPGRAKLQRVLSAVSYRNPLVNYCQSFNYMAAALLLNADEEDCFWLMVALLEDILPNDYYNRDLVGITVDLRVMDNVVQQACPSVAEHFRRQGIDATPFMAGWLMNLYVGVFPVDTVFRIWDLIFSEGAKVVFRIMLGVLKMFESDVLGMPALGELLEFLTAKCKALHNADELIATANSFRVGRTLLTRFRERHRRDVMEELQMRRGIERETAKEMGRRGVVMQTPLSPNPEDLDAPPGFDDSWRDLSPHGQEVPELRTIR